MAGNIIPAIATTNAIIAGIAVMKGFAVLRGQVDKIKRVCIFIIFKILQQCYENKKNRKEDKKKSKNDLKIDISDNSWPTTTFTNVGRST